VNQKEELRRNIIEILSIPSSFPLSSRIGVLADALMGAAEPLLGDLEWAQEKILEEQERSREIFTRFQQAEADIECVLKYVETTDDDGIRTQERILNILKEYPSPTRRDIKGEAT